DFPCFRRGPPTGGGGGRQPISVDLRVIAATNRDLKSHLQQGLFREDLYYRLSVVTIDLPPLRERGEDILLIANRFLERAGQEHRRRVRFGPDAIQAMMAHGWPGNVREMENRVSRAVIMSRGRVIVPSDLDLLPAEPAQTGSLRDTRERVERQTLVGGVRRPQGQVGQNAARAQ